jgi:hypothetical protein
MVAVFIGWWLDGNAFFLGWVGWQLQWGLLYWVVGRFDGNYYIRCVWWWLQRWRLWVELELTSVAALVKSSGHDGQVAALMAVTALGGLGGLGGGCVRLLQQLC